jgi:Mg-chelatase subunit ChlD
MSSVVDSELGSTLHDRERRAQRNVKKIDQQRARRYGMCEPVKKGRLKYTLAGNVFIWDPIKNKAVTSWSTSEASDSDIQSGTRFTDPITLQKSNEHDLPSALTQHNRLRFIIMRNMEQWKSHTVLVVDMSGSMRKDDVDGARCRSDGVWTCLAREFVKSQLEKESTSMYDLVSVVSMRDTAEVVLHCEPTDWVLYNKLVDMSEWTTLKPQGHGYYKHALEKAEELLRLNDLGSCASSLFFFSDGRPSDSKNVDLAATMGSIAARFGRRLTICCVGMANQKEDFSILKEMVKEAKAFGAVASFNKPSLSADSLSHIISSHVSSLISTKTELTELNSGKAKTVRTDIVRERVDAPDDIAPTDDWRIFRASSDERYTKRVWKWNRKHGDFCKVSDPRCGSCFKIVADEDWNILNGGVFCRGCRVCFFCPRCVATGRVHGREECLRQAGERRRGMIQKEHIPSFSIAWKNTCFGEGAERAAFKFRFLDERDNFIGSKMVAKESRFVEDHHDDANDDPSRYLRSHRHSYHLQFMRTQALASRCAKFYNESLDELAELVDPLIRGRINTFPRIRFLEPLIFELVDDVESKTYNVLVEPMLEGVYKKYNDNFGGLPSDVTKGLDKPPGQTDDTKGLDKASVDFLLGRKVHERENVGTAAGLGAIVEGSEEEEDSEEEDDDDNDYDQDRSRSPGDAEEYFDHLIQSKGFDNQRLLARKNIPDEDFAHAFSHYSYVRSGKYFMVVDLQGLLRIRADGSREFVFTDPAVHKRRESRRLKHLNFGRTNRGKKGMDAFFASHKCNDACRLLGLRSKGQVDST